MPHSSYNMKVWVVHCHPGTQKLTEVYEIYPGLTGEVLAHDINIIFLVYGSRNLQQMTKMTFVSAICTGIHGTKYNCVLQWMLVHRDPKRAAIASLTKGQPWFLCAINARNLSWVGVEQGGHPEWVRSLWEPVSRKPGMASPTTPIDSYPTMRNKQLHLVRRFWTFFEGTN